MSNSHEFSDRSLWDQIHRLCDTSLSGKPVASASSVKAAASTPVSIFDFLTDKVPAVSSSPQPPAPSLTEAESLDLEAKVARITAILTGERVEEEWDYGSSPVSSPESVPDRDSESLPEHVSYNEEVGFYYCQLCDIRARSLYMLENHLNGKEHQKRVGGEIKNLHQHVKWDTESQYFVCTLCDAKAATLYIMEGHLEGKEHIRKLGYLGGEPKQGESLPPHISWDENSQYYVCGLCDAKAATLYIMEAHLTGTKHIRNVAYLEELKLAENSKLPQHVIFDEPSQFYICTLCDAKAATLYLMEGHLGGKDHTRRVAMKEASSASWGCGPVDPISSPPGDKVAMTCPEHVSWDEKIQYFVCCLCDAKAATQYIMEAHLTGKEHQKRLANIEWYKNQPAMSEEATGDNLPAYCCLKDDYFVCNWCTKKSATWDLLLNHLGGKEHTKVCGNLGIPNYGDKGHLEASKLYFDKYGLDVWARQEHWPKDTLIDCNQVWKCTICSKKISTPAAVNDHLPCGEVEMFRPPPKKPSPSMGQKLANVWTSEAPPIVVPKKKKEIQIQCYLCMTYFPTMETLWFHEQSDPIHQELVRVAVGIMPKKNLDQPSDPRLHAFDI